MALSLGYERIVKDKRITIAIEESDDPWVTLKFLESSATIRFKASNDADVFEIEVLPKMQKDIKFIADAVHQVYFEASTYKF